MKIIDCIQGSDEWFQARLGIPTTSKFSKIVTSTGKPSTSANGYMYDLLAEYVTGAPLDGFKNEDMQRGNDLEPEAGTQHEFVSGDTIEKVGFCTLDDGSVGASPDGLIGVDGLIEIKCPKSSTMIGYYLKGFPVKYKAQVQGQLWVTERKWCKFYAYHPDMKPFKIRVERDEEFIEAMIAEIGKFNKKMNGLKEKLKVWKV